MTDNPEFPVLAEYVSPDEHVAHARFAELVSQFHFKRAASIRARNAGNVPHAQLYENEAARLSREVDDFWAASAQAIDAEAARLSRELEASVGARSLSLEELPSLVVAQGEREMADDRAEERNQ